MITRPLHFGQVRCSCLAIFSPQSGHQTSSSRLAVKTDCQTPRCLRLLQLFHSAIVIRTGLKVHGVSSFHLAKSSAFISHSLWKNVRFPSAEVNAETCSSRWIFSEQPAHSSTESSLPSKRVVLGYQAIVTGKGKDSNVHNSQKLESIQQSLSVSDACKRGYRLVLDVVPRILYVSADKLQHFVNLFFPDGYGRFLSSKMLQRFLGGGRVLGRPFFRVLSQAVPSRSESPALQKTFRASASMK